MRRLLFIFITLCGLAQPSFAFTAKQYPVLSELTEVIKAVPHPHLTTPVEERVVGYIRKTVANLRYSAYKLGGTRFDPSRGVYVLDCSSYVDNVLANATPNAYLNLVNATGVDRPNSKSYYHFFTGLSEESNQYWNKINNVEELRPGDILVFRYKRDSGGHVMVVMNKPVWLMDAFLVQVADSSPTPHSEDTRSSHSGVGIGSLLLKANPHTGEPLAYAWGMGARWDKNARIAMGRPVEVS